MEPSPGRSNELARYLMLAGLMLLAAGMLFGILGALQYVVPGTFRELLSFDRIRPLHVSSVVFWIVIAAMGSVLAYLPQHTRSPLKHPLLQKMLFPLLVATVVVILVSYLLGIFGGREYWEFHPALSLPVVMSWILFLVLFTGSLQSMKKQPVYVWMWLTGTVFFLFTFLESYLWLIPYFRENIVNDMTIQWKSYGSMVGSWNMLIYGCSLFLMDKIGGETQYGHSPVAFLLYFTGLFNLMFNWGHHIYTLPTHNYVQYISYAVSMTELFIIGRIIWQWKKSIKTAQKHFHHAAYKFLAAADVWVFLTLALAILMSVPAINLYTHGTHITVAHTMGATIGINTMLLLAFVHDTLARSPAANESVFNRGYWIANGSLLIFWVSLIAAGIMKSVWQMSGTQSAFAVMMRELRPFFMVFLFSGVSLVTGLLMIIVPVLKYQLGNNGIIQLYYKSKLS